MCSNAISAMHMCSLSTDKIKLQIGVGDTQSYI